MCTRAGTGSGTLSSIWRLRIAAAEKAIQTRRAGPGVLPTVNAVGNRLSRASPLRREHGLPNKIAAPDAARPVATRARKLLRTSNFSASEGVVGPPAWGCRAATTRSRVESRIPVFRARLDVTDRRRDAGTRPQVR
jgi:hypothetical protein